MIMTIQVRGCRWLDLGERQQGRREDITGVLILSCDFGQMISPVLNLGFPIYKWGDNKTPTSQSSWLVSV